VAFDLVPWAIEGASTDAALARVLANIASHNAEGVNLPGDFKVSALGTPGPQVSVATGGMVVRNAQAPGESYVGIARSDTLVDIAPTSGASRSDLLIAQVIDPDFAPWQPYTDPNQKLNGPYFQPVIISGVAPSVTKASDVVSYAAYAIARIDIPNSTTNIQDTMIVDLRKLAQPQTSTFKKVVPGPVSQDNLAITDTNWRNWPTGSITVDIPEWATHCLASIRLNQVQVDTHGSDFIGRVNIGGIAGQGVNFDFNGAPSDPAGVVSALPFEIFADVDVTSLQGQTVTVKPEVERTYTQNTGGIWFTSKQQVIYDLVFYQQTA
jgi:hypothetical protein